ncbi:hypothetical protein O3P69_003602 [Scylla paramamosain]|uniref:Uncharacterized protein n=1 Tax=Scylla paramamosain TaxID=85552 RepID=A0AAW0UHV3_SCYPA
MAYPHALHFTLPPLAVCVLTEGEGVDLQGRPRLCKHDPTVTHRTTPKENQCRQNLFGRPSCPFWRVSVKAGSVRQAGATSQDTAVAITQRHNERPGFSLPPSLPPVFLLTYIHPFLPLSLQVLRKLARPVNQPRGREGGGLRTMGEEAGVSWSVCGEGHSRGCDDKTRTTEASLNPQPAPVPPWPRCWVIHVILMIQWWARGATLGRQQRQEDPRPG